MSCNNDDLRLIEDYLPIEAISKEASREKSVRKGHISTLHLWWARRPLVACRAAVYGALVPADRWVKDINVKNGEGKNLEAFKNGTKKGLNRKHAKEFVTKLCRYPKTDPKKPEDIKIKRETEAAIVEAQKHILEAHAERLTKELQDWKKSTTDSTDDTDKTDKGKGKAGPASSSSHPCHPCDPWSGPSAPSWVKEFKFTADRVTYDDILAGRAPRPRVLDMFAGGGAIPLEALRLGCEAYALDLNPVAHIIQLCTLVYPQKYGKPDPAARGMTGPKDVKGETTWGGLANEVRYWGNWVLERVRKEIGDLYPLIPDPNYKTGTHDAGAPKKGASGQQIKMQPEDDEDGDDESGVVDVPAGYLKPVAYLWTRTVRCKNPRCGADVPLVRSTWLRKKDGRAVALRMTAPPGKKRARFEVIERNCEEEFDFDPADLSSAGNATCPFCPTVADAEYTKRFGSDPGYGIQPMGVVCVRPGKQGKIYLPRDEDDEVQCGLQDRLNELQKRLGISYPSEKLEANPRSFDVQRYGFSSWSQVFTPRQHCLHLAVVGALDQLNDELRKHCDQDRQIALHTAVALAYSRLVTQHNAFSFIHSGRETFEGPWGDGKFPMSWDFVEVNPLSGAGGSCVSAMKWAVEVHSQIAGVGPYGHVSRGSATELAHPDASFDAVVSDPPYYDSVSYSNLSDAFYVWLKRSLRHHHADHFTSELTPKKKEAIAAAYRHSGNKVAAAGAYEELMAASLGNAHRVLKPGGAIAIVYAHKTTLGWSTLVDALRAAGFTIVEAWPLDTEMKGGRKKVDRAMLASSIFLIARKRHTSVGVGNYEDDVQPDLQQIVRERVETLWDMGIAGADLVIACVGAGLRAFTKYEKVEYANGEEVPAQKFLAEVEGVVLDTMMGKLSGVTGGNVAAVDPASRFYVLWRFVYKAAEIDAGEAIVFTYAQHVELDGPNGLSDGKDALVEKKKAKYRCRDFTERGMHEKLGLPAESGEAGPLIDVLHRVLWLMENSPRKLGEFLDQARPDRERLRVLAQALAGAALSGKSEEEAAKLVSTTPAEQSALGKLLANWRSLIESRMVAGEEGLFGRKK